MKTFWPRLDATKQQEEGFRPPNKLKYNISIGPISVFVQTEDLITLEDLKMEERLSMMITRRETYPQLL